ncbi:S41 family peptidase [Oscillibacter sp.]|uniref:S41 family peptidase n=1 Tax=Oscillibacter sp. TaxID=1945593 RepID=UPI0028B10192|nr:S41 family peptidase [Oscillibacter sp.]
MKKNRWLALALCFTLLCGCSAKPEKQTDTPSDNDASTKAIHALGLTAEQRMEDYEAFWATLRDSYPCWGILEREGVDADAIYQDYKELVAGNDSDVNFYSAIFSSLYRLGINGHLWIVEPDDYASYVDNMAAYQDSDRAHWAEVLQDEKTVNGYEKLGAMLDILNEDEDQGGNMVEDISANITSQILPGNIGYLKINSFSGDMEIDGAEILDCYSQFAGCSDLIIDLTDNSGGSENYWEQLLVAPNINETVSNSHVALVRMSKNNTPYLENVFSSDELRPISALPDLSKLADADRALATHYVTIDHTVDPAAQRSPFHGAIWVLVSEAVYSASESFALFCKDTGFATLVGTQTGGDGIGIDPIFLQLPNSGILVQFTALYGLNADGSSNEETGTTPDIVSIRGENSLVTALRAIEAQKEAAE